MIIKTNIRINNYFIFTEKRWLLFIRYRYIRRMERSIKNELKGGGWGFRDNVLKFI